MPRHLPPSPALSVPCPTPPSFRMTHASSPNASPDASPNAPPRRLEDKHGLSNPVYSLSQRPAVISSALQYSRGLGMRDDTAYDALVLFDRVMSCQAAVEMASTWALVMVCCLLLCARQSAEAPQPGGAAPPWQSLEAVQVRGLCVRALGGMGGERRQQVTGLRCGACERAWR